jgi:hypothetical protein
MVVRDSAASALSTDLDSSLMVEALVLRESCMALQSGVFQRMLQFQLLVPRHRGTAPRLAAFRSDKHAIANYGKWMAAGHVRRKDERLHG